jgi:hypothetical protein
MRVIVSGNGQNSLAVLDGKELEKLNDAFKAREGSIKVVYPLAEQ